MRSVYSAILILLTSTALLAYAIRQEYSQTIVKDFPIQADGEVTIENRYGSVEVNTWPQNRVKISVTITVRATSEQKAQKVFDDVDIKFTSSSAQVAAKTVISLDDNWWNWDEEKKDFSIQYEVWLPQSVDLEVRNKYGDVAVAEMDGNTHIHLQYGNLQLPKLNNDLHLEFSHGTGQIGQVKDLEGMLSYCNLQLAQARDLRIETEYSNLQIDQAQEVFANAKYNRISIGNLQSFDYEGRYDVVEIDQVDRFHAIAKYSDFHLGSVVQAAAFDLEFGLVQLDRVESGFEEINLTGRFTDYQVDIAPGASYHLEAAADYAGISYPTSMNVTYEQESSTYHLVEGYQGQEGGGSVIKAQLNYGGLKVSD
jgi:hypothetical protein